MTLPPELGAKFAQALAHETPEWHATYSNLRNSVEGMNGFIKDGAQEGIGDPQRRRIRGVAAQSVLVAFQLLGANLRKIDEFLSTRAADAKKIRRLPSRRRTKSLSNWAPNPSTGGADKDTESDPDPPVIACPWPVSSPRFWPPDVRTLRCDVQL